MINPDVDLHDRLFPDVVWFCNGCGEMLNVQKGFCDDCGFWICEECEHVNVISEEEIY